MARAKAETSNSLKISWLKKQGYFPKGESWRSGNVTWTLGMSENKSSIGIDITAGMTEEENYIRLHYTYTDYWTKEKSDMNYKIQLETTPCHFGGVRYWFICPLSKNGQYCGRRVGVIYNIGKWFGCRHCGDIAYQAQFEGGNFRMGSVTEPDVEKAFSEAKTHYYNGKPTRKYKRYLRLRQKMNNSWIRAASRFGNIF
ncbi:MAG: hypothetical protein K8Q97_02010 [Candidatus Andersenbacteria bacterium]|nr:hypothetical protein [Candidatus Andersenbacteria bacterium]